MATILIFAVAAYVIWNERRAVIGFWRERAKDFSEITGVLKIFYILGGGLSVVIMACALCAWSLPPHLIQEFDALNYHLTLPRQHLILGTFKHIPWSSGDLFPLPVDFALAPFWLVHAIPDKLPQALFFIGLILVAVNLLKRFDGGKSVWLLVFAILGSHAIGIQMGLAMLDLVTCYLFVAAVDSFLEGAVLLAAVEFTFFFWSKSFIPFQMVLIFFVLISGVWLFKKMGFKAIRWGFSEEGAGSWKKENGKTLKNIFILFVLLSFPVGGPFVGKSLYYSGTPLYPLAPGIVPINDRINNDSKAWQALIRASESHLEAKDMYGSGRGPVAFIKHFWLLAVPDKDVNNPFDYPMGLPYLLLMGPFLFLFYSGLKRKELSITGLFIIIYWFLWWLGSQHTRFLYIPLILMFVLVLSRLKASQVLTGALLVALAFNALSITRAYKWDLTRSFQGVSVLREKDKEILEMNEQYLSQGRTDVVPLEYHDAAFARFPVVVTKEKLPFVMGL